MQLLNYRQKIRDMFFDLKPIYPELTSGNAGTLSYLDWDYQDSAIFLVLERDCKAPCAVISAISWPSSCVCQLKAGLQTYFKFSAFADSI